MKSPEARDQDLDHTVLLLPIQDHQEVRQEVRRGVLLLLTTILLDPSLATKATLPHRAVHLGVHTTTAHLRQELLELQATTQLTLLTLVLVPMVLDQVREVTDLHPTGRWVILPTVPHRQVVTRLLPTLLLPLPLLGQQEPVLLLLPPPRPTTVLLQTFRSWRTPSTRWRSGGCRETRGTPRPGSSTSP